MKVAFHTLGCKLNFAESSALAREFLNKGFERVDFGEPADVIFINSCTVTASADKKTRQAIKKAGRTSPNAYIVLTGCYAQSDANEIAEKLDVDMILGMNEKFNFFKYYEKARTSKKTHIYSCKTEAIERFDSAYSSGDRTRAFLKVQDGCDYPCTYCKIPSVRGKSRNPKINRILEDAEKIAAEGFKEIVLTGVNIGDFGKSTGESFLQLIKSLEQTEGIRRYRISSIEPNLLSDEIIEFCADSDKFLPHFHIPLQSGSNEILKKMKRRYKRERFADRLEKIRMQIPDAYIAADVIVGFPGENQSRFQESLDFLRSSDIASIHSFSYSERKGTQAAQLSGKNPKKIIAERSRFLQQLSDKKETNFYIKHIGQVRPVLFEAAKHKNKMYGFTDNYIKTEIPFNKDYVNKIIRVKLSGIATSGNMSGEIPPDIRNFT